jgi:hypothetical protein
MTRETHILDRSIAPKAKARANADLNNPLEVPAPIPGLIVSIAVGVGVAQSVAGLHGDAKPDTHVEHVAVCICVADSQWHVDGLTVAFSYGHGKPHTHGVPERVTDGITGSFEFADFE